MIFTMRKESLKNSKIFTLPLSLFLCFFFTCRISYGQMSTYSAGINAGLSTFESLSTSISGIHISGFYEFPAWFSKSFNFQTSLFYLRKTEYFLPEDSQGKYYPYFYGASFSGVMRQRIKNQFFAEEQAGFMILRNHFFSYKNETNYGVCFGLAGGIDLRNGTDKGFLLSIGYKGGITLNGDTPSFNSFLLQAQYLF